MGRPWTFFQRVGAGFIAALLVALVLTCTLAVELVSARSSRRANLLELSMDRLEVERLRRAFTDKVSSERSVVLSDDAFFAEDRVRARERFIVTHERLVSRLVTPPAATLLSSALRAEQEHEQAVREWVAIHATRALHSRREALFEERARDTRLRTYATLHQLTTRMESRLGTSLQSVVETEEQVLLLSLVTMGLVLTLVATSGGLLLSRLPPPRVEASPPRIEPRVESVQGASGVSERGDETARPRTRAGTFFFAEALIDSLLDEDSPSRGDATRPGDVSKTTPRESTEVDPRSALKVDEADAHEMMARIGVRAHDLGIPFDTLQWLLRGLERVDPSSEPDRVRDGVGRALEQSRRLGQLLLDLWDVSSQLTGRQVAEPVDLSHLAHEVMERFTESAAQAGSPLLFDAEPGLVGRWDRLGLEQVLTHLIAHALELGAGHPVRLRVERVGRTRARIVVEGMPLPDGGAGLGRHLVQQWVDSHGGTLRMEGTSGDGATCTVELPLLEQPLESAPA
ncbi:HAMP domain-containing sensor histidine kinase [Myxococcus faecalis]|uniref:sensor histidine kinase n=1 Tax=Myxococcus faecalis TaxID=3115646 RepID=UPI003CED677F